jgi:PBP1b-binding outer membrane lipoprotein LpoB
VGHCPTEGIEMVLATTGEMVWNGHGTIKNWVR